MPSSVVMQPCSSQEDIDVAFATWVSSFMTIGGCQPTTSTDLSGLIAPDRCDGGVIVVDYMAADDCGNTAMCTSSFTVQADTAAPTFDFAMPDGATMTVECNNADEAWNPFSVMAADLNIMDNCTEQDDIEVTFEDALLERRRMWGERLLEPLALHMDSDGRLWQYIFVYAFRRDRGYDSSCMVVVPC
ncbi:MAG: hypothetical protein R2795_09450 [Saprospiraceae bacterium]